jgi:hypothetical protein
MASGAVTLCLIAPATAAPFKPQVGKYAATAAGTGAQNALTLKVQRRNRTYRSTILKLTDDCAGGLLPVPAPLGRIFAKDIKYEASGASGGLTWQVRVEGRFTSARRATIRIRSYLDHPILPPGSPPSAASVCRDDTTFALRYLKPKK